MSTVSEKGQVTIPKKYREKLGLTPGSEVDFEERDGELVLHKEGVSLDEYEGYLGEGDVETFMQKVRGRE